MQTASRCACNNSHDALSFRNWVSNYEIVAKRTVAFYIKTVRKAGCQQSIALMVQMNRILFPFVTIILRSHAYNVYLKICSIYRYIAIQDENITTQSCSVIARSSQLCFNYEMFLP